MRNACSRVCLVHELRKLRGTEEFLDRGHNRANVNKRLRCKLVGILRVHAFTRVAFHARKANAELVLNKFAHGANTAVTKVVDIIGGNAFFAFV